MLSQEEIIELLSDLESDRVERTESVQNTDKFARAVCAFANDMPGHRKPGVLIVGARDDGSLSGLKVSDQLLQNLGALRSDGNILPPPSLRVYKVALEGGELAVVEVDPSDLPPVRYKGRVCVRVGPRRAEANEQEERRLAERRSQTVVTFDVHPVPQATLADLSLGVFEHYRDAIVPADVIATNNRTTEEKLASLRFFDLERGAPTVAGVLSFGRKPTHFLPGAYIQFLRLAGDDLTELPLDQAQIAGDLLMLVRELDARVRAHIQVGMQQVPGSLQERLLPSYPHEALRELIFNTIVHRDYQSTSPTRVYWYSDHIEIQNPGGLFGGVTPETLTTRNSYRNPVIAEAMFSLGYVNRFGYGIQRAQRLLEQNDNPPLEFTIDDDWFRVVVRARRRP